MPALKNARHEAFARALVEGKSASEAYVEAGYSESRSAASRLSTNVNVTSRVAELMAAAAERTMTTVEDITARLYRIADAAEAIKEASGLSVARAALMDIAKLNGLVVDKTENRTFTYEVTDKPLSEEEWEKEFCPKGPAR
ncbi:terminase small subunit [Ancylobacter sp.]|uniref:terminase small subunit n=1 Tax=Ancylobacter sp. TaxID=1872567 RepID=UPI003D1110DA